MNNNEKSEINALILILEHQIMGLGTTLSIENNKLNDLKRKVEWLKSLRDSSLFDNQASLNRVQLSQILMESIPHSVRARLIALTEQHNYTSEQNLAKLCKEACSLLLYDAIYAEVDEKHDLNNAMLSRVIKSCIDHEGELPNSPDRQTLLSEYPQILPAIESAYQNNSSRNLKSCLRIG